MLMGITDWTNNAGLEADDVDTLGLTLNYFINDNVPCSLSAVCLQK
jgi:outer membrane protein